jgi:hypothetical protein
MYRLFKPLELVCSLPEFNEAKQRLAIPSTLLNWMFQGIVSVTLKFEDVKHLSQLLRLIATEVQHDGHAIQADREWIQKCHWRP